MSTVTDRLITFTQIYGLQNGTFFNTYTIIKNITVNSIVSFIQACKDNYGLLHSITDGYNAMRINIEIMSFCNCYSTHVNFLSIFTEYRVYNQTTIEICDTHQHTIICRQVATLARCNIWNRWFSLKSL